MLKVVNWLGDGENNMFGMLDYRAHKLFLILFGIPYFLLNIFNIFGLPYISYYIGHANFDDRFVEILVSVIALFVISWSWFLIVFLLNKIFYFIFELLVDVIPHDGRTEAEAKQVVFSGKKMITALEIQKHPSTWDSELIARASKIDWVMRLFYHERYLRQIQAIHEEYQDDPEGETGPAIEEGIWMDYGIPLLWQQKYLTNPIYRGVIYQTIFFLYLIFMRLGF